ncbi:5'-methylthioadenosine/S-adenosylhomocysteine nucleosidase family protein, partial [Streptacidiphilus carbonis]|uniref:5'-methylthioadenosine/S-adenosylhomocysteine nucleosidase family protein n=1 Tax=Streptacidiphilus carbonis TaxID=105422 RepID=UPI0007C6A028
MSREPARPGRPDGRPLLLACALGAEQAALRAGVRGAPPVRLIRTGMGGDKAFRSVSSALAQLERAPGAFLFAGFGAAVGPGIRPGDVLVATEVRDAGSDSGDGATELPGPDALVGALRSAGLTVHTGPLFSADAVVRGERRAELHAAGVLGVDMETAGALRALPAGLPAAAVRVVVDTPEHELLRPGILLHGLRAWRALRTAAPVLAAFGSPYSERALVTSS